MKKTQNFETRLTELEKIVSDLEKGDLSLEDSVKKFEEGMQISKECNSILENAEKRITIILESNGKIQEEDFDIEN